MRTMVIIIMGVSGSGKTTVGELLAKRMGIPFFDGDSFHSNENIRKMRCGIPLTDADREPWLRSLAAVAIESLKFHGAVIACSALKQYYRDILQNDNQDIRFVFLKGPMDLIHKRMLLRKEHYMPPDLLKSQFDILEEPSGALVVPINISPEEIVELIVKSFKIEN